MSSSRPAAFRRGPTAKPRSKGEACRRGGAHALDALGDQDAVVGVEFDDVGHGAERHQVEQVVQLRLGLRIEHAAPAQFRAQRQQHIKHHAHAGQVLAGEAAFGLVRIDDHARRRQGIARQVVVGDDDVDAAPVRFHHAVDAGDAVVDRDDDVGRLFAAGEFDDFRRQAVAVHHAVGHDVVDVGAHRAQAAQGGGAGGGAIAVVVGDDGHFLARANRVGQEHGRGVDVFQAARRYQRGQFAGQFAYVDQAAGGVDAGQDGVHAALAQHFGLAEGAGAGRDAGFQSSRSREMRRQKARCAMALVVNSASASRWLSTSVT
jgi:hypothetical protein